jgi:hypothetical protein
LYWIILVLVQAQQDVQKERSGELAMEQAHEAQVNLERHRHLERAVTVKVQIQKVEVMMHHPPPQR